MDEVLAREVLLDHFKNPRGRGAVPGGLRREGVNPACGDKVSVTGVLSGGRWTVRTEGAGCVISQASASLMAEALEGRPTEEARALASSVVRWMSGRGPRPEGPEGLDALAGVRGHPSRIKCACLAWNLFLEGEASDAH